MKKNRQQSEEESQAKPHSTTRNHQLPLSNFAKMHGHLEQLLVKEPSDTNSEKAWAYSKDESPLFNLRTP